MAERRVFPYGLEVFGKGFRATCFARHFSCALGDFSRTFAGDFSRTVGDLDLLSADVALLLSLLTRYFPAFGSTHSGRLDLSARGFLSSSIALKARSLDVRDRREAGTSNDRDFTSFRDVTICRLVFLGLNIGKRSLNPQPARLTEAIWLGFVVLHFFLTIMLFERPS